MAQIIIQPNLIGEMVSQKHFIAFPHNPNSDLSIKSWISKKMHQLLSGYNKVYSPPQKGILEVTLLQADEIAAGSLWGKVGGKTGSGAKGEELSRQSTTDN